MVRPAQEALRVHTRGPPCRGDEADTPAGAHRRWCAYVTIRLQQPAFGRRRVR